LALEGSHLRIRAPGQEKVSPLTIELAQRLQRIRPSATVSITARAQRLREQGRDVIVLSVGEPDFPTPEHVKAAAIAALARNDTKYTPVDGSRLLKEAIVAKLARDNGLVYAPEQVLVSTGAKQSCYNACLALLDPGDEAIVLAPYWVSYPDMVRLAEASPVVVEAAVERGFKVTAEQLASALTARTRLVILNSPCNPTGAVYSAAELRALGEVLRAHPSVVVLSDEIYEHICWTNGALASFAAVCPELYDRTLTVNGMSKGYAMSGWRIGYAAGPLQLIKAMTALQGQSTTNACTISQAAAREALVADQSCVREMCAEFKRRHDFFYAGVRRLRGFECIAADGTFYLFPNVEAAMHAKGVTTDLELCERLIDEAGVALVPGTAFGSPGHLRLSFAASTSVLESALARLGEFFRG
jgi:aspartate aminotransferase